MNPPAPEVAAQLAWLAAVTDPTRFAVLRALASGPKNVNRLSLLCGNVPQSNMSHHLSILREVGLVSSEARGKSRVYALVAGAVTVGDDALELAHSSGLKVVLPRE